MVRIPAAIVAALLVLFIAQPAMAAVNGLVRGTVTIDGKPAANVPVTLEGEGSRFNATTRSDGEYVFSEVPFGSYRLTVAAKGIAKYVVIVEVNSGIGGDGQRPALHAARRDRPNDGDRACRR